MNAGAAAARGDILLFLHADTCLPEGAAGLVAQAMAGGHRWGRFDVRIEGKSVWLPLVAALMNLRSCLTGIATGDQAVFVARESFVAVGGFPDIPLMEDIELSRRLRRIGRPACLAARVTTSGGAGKRTACGARSCACGGSGCAISWVPIRGASPRTTATHRANPESPARAAIFPATAATAQGVAADSVRAAVPAYYNPGSSPPGHFAMDPQSLSGIEEIDAQHKEIEETARAVIEAVAARDKWHVVHYILVRLYELLRFHFAVEESVMSIVSFPTSPRTSRCTGRSWRWSSG